MLHLAMHAASPCSNLPAHLKASQCRSVEGEAIAIAAVGRRSLRERRQADHVTLCAQIRAAVKDEPAPNAPQGRSAALKLAMARPSEPASTADNGVTAEAAANTNSKAERASIPGPAQQGVEGSPHALVGLPAPGDVGLAPGLPDPVLSPRSGASGSLLDLLLSDEDPPAADPEAVAGTSATLATDAAPSPPKEQGVWTHERELPLWLIFGFEEGRVRAEAEAAERAARAASAQAQLGVCRCHQVLTSCLQPYPVSTHRSDGWGLPVERLSDLYLLYPVTQCSCPLRKLLLSSVCPGAASRRSQRSVRTEADVCATCGEAAGEPLAWISCDHCSRCAGLVNILAKAPTPTYDCKAVVSKGLQGLNAGLGKLSSGIQSLSSAPLLVVMRQVASRSVRRSR